MIFLSFIGNHDIFVPKTEAFGPALNVFNNYKDSIEYLFFFVTPNSQKFDYLKIANENANYIKSINPGIHIELINVQIDYDLIYPIMLDEVLGVIEKYNLCYNSLRMS